MKSASLVCRRVAVRPARARPKPAGRAFCLTCIKHQQYRSGYAAHCRLGCIDAMADMTGQLTEPPSADFMLIAEKEMLALERKERELRSQERLDRAQEKFPTLMKELQS